MSLKSEILAAAACPEGETTIAGKTVRIRGMSGQEEDKFFPPASGDRVNGYGICAACIIDAKGEPLFTEDELRSMKAGVLSEAVDAIVALSRPSVEEERKNS